MSTSDVQMPASVTAALAMADVALGYLRDPGAGSLMPPELAGTLEALGVLGGKLAAARAAILNRFDAERAYAADGHGSSTAWLRARGRMTGKAAAGQVRQFREHPAIEGAVAAGEVSESWAGELAEWTRKLPEDWRQDVDRLLADTAAAGANLEDLAVVARAAYEKWRSQQADPDDGDDGFDDRFLRLGTTIDNAGRVNGNLTPECTAALQAVLDALGKKRGPEDDRTDPQRFHDALQEACELLLRARLVPDRAGADTHVDAVIDLARLLDLPGASELQEAWLAALVGEHGYLTGKDAEAAACDAIVSPVVTAHPDLAIVDQMIDVMLGFLEPHVNLAAGTDWHDARYARYDTGHTGTAGRTGDRSHGETGNEDAHVSEDEAWHSEDTDETRHPDNPATPATNAANRYGRASTTGNGASRAHSRDTDETRHPDNPATPASNAADKYTRASTTGDGASRARLLSPEAWQALRCAIARLAIDLVSGPDRLASILRQGLLEAPYNSKPVVLDVGYSETVPGAIRRAVQLRARHCEWPGCRKPPAHCDVHHLRHKRDGGPTSVRDCVLLCQFHHDVCIHRQGWRLVLHPDGTTTAHGPRGQVLRSHGPPGSSGPPGSTEPPDDQVA